MKLPFTRKKAEERALLAQSMYQTWSSYGAGQSLAQGEYAAYVSDGYKANGVIFAVVLARLMLFSEATFKFRDRVTKELSDSPELDILDEPWPNGTTGDLLALMEQDASLAGNALIRRTEDDYLERLRPDWVDTVMDDHRRVFGYVYFPQGRGFGGAMFLPVEQVAHWMPIPDPMCSHRGMSWLTPICREVDADNSMNAYLGKFMDNAATPNLLVKMVAKLDPEDRKRIEEQFARRYGGVGNAFKTLLIDNAADTTVEKIGLNFQEMDFGNLRGATETRIAAAGGVPPIVVGLKDGLEIKYNNYEVAMRRFADVTMRPNWRSACGALRRVVKVPNGQQLWFDTAGIAALSQDEKTKAEIFRAKAETAGILIRAGYDPLLAGKVAWTGEGLAELPHSGSIPVTLYPEGQDPKVAQQGRSDERMLAAWEALATRDTAPHITIEGARTEVHPPNVTIDQPDITVNQPDINVTTPEVRVEPAQVTVEPAQVTVTTPEVRVEPTINVEQPDITVNVPAPKATTKTVLYDEKGKIAQVVEE